jgi:phosphate/sulfate permease
LLPIEISVYIAIAAALFFDFVNGFHDSANSIATVVGTRVLRPLYAVGIAALANFAGPFIFGTAVAVTVGKGIITIIFDSGCNICRFSRRYHMGPRYLVFWSSIIK